SELDADEELSGPVLVAHMNDLALGGKVGFPASAGGLAERDIDFQIGAHGDIEPGDERRPAAAQVFARSLFHEADAAAIAPPHRQRQANRNAALRAWTPGFGFSLKHARPPKC